ncbi:MAG: protease modulator HflC [Alphaproteobacteria bacterium]|nr:protease modulator HflC [Alphaproteobacteria bacterium]
MSKSLLAGLLFAGLALIAGFLSLYSVDETQQALVVRLGKPVGVVSSPGLHVKMPLVDIVNYYDARLLPLEPPTEQVILGDQKRIEVETYTRYRIVDALRFYQTMRTRDQANIQLSQLVSSSLRRELGQVMLPALLSERRIAIVGNVQREVSAKASTFGIEVVDVRIRRADLPSETSQAIYDRMKSEREREAKELRAQGFEWAQQIQAKAERERTELLSNAQLQSKITHAQADAEASRKYTQAFAKDPEFFAFSRALQTYRKALADSAPTLVLSPDAPFLRYMKEGPDGNAFGRH